MKISSTKEFRYLENEYQSSKKINLSIDGKLDDPIWDQFTSHSCSSRLTSRSDVSTQQPIQTWFKIFADQEAVYVGIYAEEPTPSRLAKQYLGRNTPACFSQDVVEIFLDPTGKGTTYYQFAVSSSNSRFSGYFIESGRLSGGTYNPEWDSGVYIGENYWSVEMRIPLSAFYKTYSWDCSDSWLLNVARERHSTPPELITWATLIRSFHEPGRFGKGKFFPRKPSTLDIRIENIEGWIVEKVSDGYLAEIHAHLYTGQGARTQYRIKIVSEKGEELATTCTQCFSEITPVSWNKVQLESIGKNILKFQIFALDGKIIQEYYEELRVTYDPIQIMVEKPIYSHCIFPDESISHIEGEVIIKGYQNLSCTDELKIELLHNSQPIYSSLIRPEGNRVPFSIPTQNLPEGNYELCTTLFPKSQSIKHARATIRKLSSLSPGTIARIDEHKNLIVNGKPIFFRSWYGGTIWGVSQALQEKYKGERPSPAINGWNCIVDMQAERIDPSPLETERKLQDVVPSDKVMETTKQRVAEAKNNPATWLYYLTDEPEYRPLSPVYLRHQYRLIKDLDPYHPVLICTNEPAKYAGCADIIAPDPYTNPTIDENGHRSMLSPKIIRKAMQEVCAVKTVAPWCIPQAFSYYFQDDQADYPTFTEYRCSVFTAVINGAKGIWPFIYCDHFNTIDLRLGCNYVFEELESLDTWLLAPISPAPVKIEAPEEGVDAWVKTVNGITLLMAVNLLDQPVTAKIFSPEWSGIQKLFGFHHQEEVTVHDHYIQLSFDPYQVKLFTSRKINDQIKSLEEFLQELTQAKIALAKPGNLLYGRGKEIIWHCTPQGNEVGQGTFKQLYTLCDGIEDNLGYLSTGKSGEVTMSFSTFFPTFNRMVLYSITARDLDISIWENNNWCKIAEVRGHCGENSPTIHIRFPKSITTSRIRIEILDSRPGFYAELNEIELYYD